MLSDEEKKAIEILKDNIKSLEGHTPFKHTNYEKVQAIETILNLIENQSKEIEELKTQIDEHVYYDLGGRSCGKTELLRHYKKGYDMNNKFWKDKIKAKIEEIDEEIKVKREIAKNPMDRVAGRLLTDSIVELERTKKVLQSLLEKE